MKPMTKEQLIHLFLEELQDDSILEKIISKTEIENRLNKIIKTVTYHTENQGTRVGDWNPNNGNITFYLNNMNEQNEKEAVIHELLHALTTSVNQSTTYYKSGLLFFNSDKDIVGRGLNEGLTTWLAEEITGKSTVYQTQKATWNAITLLMDKEILLSKYLDNNILETFVDQNEEEFEGALRNLFKDDFIKKYGQGLGIEMNEAFQKVVYLLDKLTSFEKLNDLNDVNTKSKEMCHQIKEEMEQILGFMILQLIENESNLEKKMKTLFQATMYLPNTKEIFFNKKEELLNALKNNTDLSLKEKLKLLKAIRSEEKNYGVTFIPNSILEGILFEQPSDSKWSMDEKIKEYVNLYRGDRSELYKRIYEGYKKTGRIVEEDFSKEEMLKMLVEHYIKTPEDLSKLEEFKYYKIGNHYELKYKDENDLWLSEQVFDGNGNFIRPKYISRTKKENGNVQYDSRMIKYFKEEEWENLKQQIETINEQNNKRDSFWGIVVIGSDIRFLYDEAEDLTVVTYSINEKGILEPATVRRREKNNR